MGTHGPSKQLTCHINMTNMNCLWKLLHTPTNVCCNITKTTTKKTLKKQHTATQSTVGLVESNYWITRGPSFWSARHWDTEREGEGGHRETCHCSRMSFQCETDALPAKTPWYLRVPSHSTPACTFAHVHYLCITTTSKQSAKPTVGVRQHLRGVQWGLQHCHKWKLGGNETGYWQKKDHGDCCHRSLLSHENSLLAIFFNLVTQ